MNGARIKVVVLIPERDNEGQSHSVALWRLWEARLMTTFGGYTVERKVSGQWANEMGERFSDISHEYVVALTSWRQLPAWLAVVSWACRLFRQEAVFTEIAGVPEILAPMPDLEHLL